MPTLTLIAEQCLAQVPGGTGRYTAQLGAALAAAPPPGWSVRSVTAWHRSVGLAGLARVDGPHRLPAGRRVLPMLWQRGLPPWPTGDSVHAATPLAPTRRGVPLVAVVHDSVPWTHPETLTPRGVRWHRAMIARLAKYADLVVTPSRAAADDLDQLLHLGDRLRVVPHGVSPLPLPADPGEAAARLARLSLPQRFLLSLSTLEPRKGLDVLIAALGHRALSGEQLVLAGQPGWGGVDLAAAAAAAGVDPQRIRVLGRVDDLDLALVLDRAAVVVAPSRAEGFGLPVLEAMAAGKPVVHSGIAAHAEVAGGVGLAVPVGDPAALAGAVRGLLDDAALAVELGVAGRRRAGEFTWQAAATATWRLHLEVAGDASTGNELPGPGWGDAVG